jgi:ABC-type dipeptide/oligopeptide/nickel transport system permease subunit
MESFNVKPDLQTGLRLASAALIALTVIVAFQPNLLGRVPGHRAASFLPSTWYQDAPDGEDYALGTDYLGRPFLPVLIHAASRTLRFALIGTAAVVAGCLAVGVPHGSTRSRSLEAIVSAGNLGVLAVPEAAVLITLAASWPRTADPLLVNISMLGVLVVFAVPSGARLIADRVRALGKSGFVAASRAQGATYGYTLRNEIRPHIAEDVAWIVAWTIPRFIAIEVGMAYLGVEYREFEGLGRLLAKCFSNMSDDTAFFQMLVTIAAIVSVALVPQLLLRLNGLQTTTEAVR